MSVICLYHNDVLRLSSIPLRRERTRRYSENPAHATPRAEKVRQYATLSGCFGITGVLPCKRRCASSVAQVCHRAGCSLPGNAGQDILAGYAFAREAGRWSVSYVISSFGARYRGSA